MTDSIHNKVENIVEKEKKCWLPAFSLFSQCFDYPLL